MLPSEPSGEPGATPTTEPEVPLESLGGFEGVFDPATGEISIRALEPALDTGGTLGTKADPMGEVPGSSSGVPSGGGVVAFSSGPSTSSGCPSGGARCGPVRLVNRTTGSKVLRNAFAVVTEISSGWTVANDDGARTFTFPGVSGTPVGYLYYEHLSPSDWPTAGTSPESGKVGFRADRMWSFAKTTPTAADEFKFKFYVYAYQHACTPSVQEETPNETGYDPKVDRDCDGVPGVSRNRAIFVDPVNGNDSAADGSILRPFKTPGAAAAEAGGVRDTLVIGAGNYSGLARLDLSAHPVRNVIGAFDASNGFADRRLNGSSNIDPTSTVLTFAAAAPGFGIYRAGASAPLYVEGVEVRVTAAGAGSSAYAIFNEGSGGASLTVRDASLFATAANGTNGAAGATGAAGLPGSTGAYPSAPRPAGASAPVCAVGTSGAGGAGGAGAEGFGIGGTGGDGAAASTGAAGGGGGVWVLAPTGRSGTGGQNGGAGTAAGPAALQSTWFGAAGFSPTAQNGGDGTGGTNGGGGGGGAGEGAFFSTGQHGSSGGSGGCGATPGRAGTAGGGAFAIYSPIAATVTLQGAVSATVVAGNGGNGGSGANGGGGGAGGPATNASAGGSGGAGGASGGGAGANGGPAICVVTRATPSGATSTCNNAVGGSGGLGGGGPIPGPSGSAGVKLSQHVF